MHKNTIEILTRPFPAHLIKKASGRGGSVTYVEIAAYVNRLNEAFNYDWSFEITHQEVQWDAEEVLVRGRLTAGDVSKEQIGTDSIKFKKETEHIPKNSVSIGNNLKSAATDALKKCATQLGIGLDLYGDYEGKPKSDSKKQSPASGGDSKKGEPSMGVKDVDFYETVIRNAADQEKLDSIAADLAKKEMSASQKKSLKDKWGLRRDALAEEAAKRMVEEAFEDKPGESEK